MNTLTVPKIKDLVNKPNEQYKDIFDTLNNNMAVHHNEHKINEHKINEHKINEHKMNDNITSMTDELSIFLNDLKKNKA
jgi:hypothetical protein